MKGIERILLHNGEQISKRQLGQFGDSSSLACTNLAMRRKIRKLNGVRSMTILSQYEVTHTEGEGTFKSRHNGRDNTMYTWAGERPLVAETIDHINTEYSHLPLLRLDDKIVPG